ncbi:trehalase-like [Agrilus planipennis]|uniref:Trehalase n=1 Tax=Agrilus planipennis TaxID=224129 RepID=A0A1W4XR71_AGRPL|nr:trehalase-like [Agrilus planipennis]XP_025829607.1 trehalase-like [Agrilus planipennis]
MSWWVLLFYTILVVFYKSCLGENLPPSCDSQIYCQGELLDTVQRARIFNDSKTFVDLKLRYDSKTVLNNFENLMQSTNRHPTTKQIKTFVSDNFEDGDELKQWNPPDYKANPRFLNDVNDEVIRNFAKYVVQIWPTLARRIRDEVEQNIDKYSIIPLPKPFIIPGGRFRETYYWDTYWIIQGLLISEMAETTKGMLDNFIYMVKNYGFVPNGGRIYYLARSQPPLLTKMAYNYVKSTRDVSWLRNNIKYLDTELSYWLCKKKAEVMKGGQKYVLAHYYAPSEGPRPESYREDIESANYFPDKEQKQQFYTNIKSGAETGWDFSSRWIFDQNGGNNANLSFIDTPRIIPVDLNSFLCEAFDHLSSLYLLIGDQRNSHFWKEKHLHFRKSIQQVLWDEKDGIWYDYDNTLSKPRKYFYPSNVSPLWNNCIDPNRKSIFGKRVLEYLQSTDALKTPGGIPTSEEQSGEQWDFPNAWAPLQAIVIQGLYNSENFDAQNAAEELAKKWISANIRGYRETGELYEKYDALHSGKYGGGGEYVVQTGFGWTNGFALELVKQFFSNKTSPNANVPFAKFARGRFFK